MHDSLVQRIQRSDGRMPLSSLSRKLSGVVVPMVLTYSSCFVAMLPPENPKASICAWKTWCHHTPQGLGTLRLHGLRLTFTPNNLPFLRTLYTEFMIGNPKKVGSLGSR